MKQITLVRHAKSSWDYPQLRDHDRPLNKRGERDAPQMAAYLASHYPSPDTIVTSTALRARVTAQAMAEALDFPEEAIRLEPAIYEASTRDLLRVIQGLNAGDGHVMLVGHNPGFTSLVNLLTGADLDNLPTCGVARIAFDLDEWTQVREAGGRLLGIDRPKELPA